MRKPHRRYPIKPSPLKIKFEQPKKSTGEKILDGIKRFFMVMGVLWFVAFVIYGYVIVSLFSAARPSLPDQMVLGYHFNGDLSESYEARLPIGPSVMSFPELLDGLYAAAKDERVKGVVARISFPSYTMAQIHDISQAVQAVRDAGKFTKVISDSYGEDGNGMGEYMLASAFEEIWVQPIGMVNINGFFLQGQYFKGTLEKLGVTPDFYTREEYKSVMESFTRRGPSEEASEEQQAMLDQITDVIATRLAERRNVSADFIKTAIDKAPLPADQALRMGLIDHVDYADVLLDNIKASLQLKDENFIPLAKYAEYAARDVIQDDVEKKIAYIPMAGAIVPGSSEEQGIGFGGNTAIYARDYAAAITEAAEDEDVDAILVRIDSPGGSPTASETVRAALLYAKKRGKPIVMSMGSVAASGGYWIATAADYIVATPTTVTGSIGVASGKFVVSGLLDKLGITTSAMQYGENADFLSMTEPFDETGQERMNRSLDYIYNGFLDRVAESRGMSVEEAREIAKGKIWTGQAALNVNLIDQIGGLQDTKAYIAEKYQLDLANLGFEQYPKAKSPFEQIMRALKGQGMVSLPQALQSQINHWLTQAQLSNHAQNGLVYSDIRGF